MAAIDAKFDQETEYLDGTRLVGLTLVIMAATIMQALDTTIANVALPNMQGSMSATSEQISWVLTSYIVAAAIMTPPVGFLTAKFGRKQVFLVSIGGFTVASLLCGAATTLPQMVAFRTLQGIFGAGLVPISQAILLDSYPPEKHGSAMAMWGTGVMLGPILGPTLGGYLTEYYSWSWVFYINLPIGILTLFGAVYFLDQSEDRKNARFDWFGFLMLSISIGALQLMLDRGQSVDWFHSTEIITYAVLTGLCLYLFIVQILTSDNPFLNASIFRDRNFCIGIIFIFMVGIVLLATSTLLPPFLQGLMGYPVLTTGLVMAPRGLGSLVSMLIVGRIIRYVDLRLIIATGLLLTAYSLHIMSGFTKEVSQDALITSSIYQGLGLGAVFVPLSTLTFSTLDRSRRVEGTSLFSLVRNIGSSIGISIMATLVSFNTQTLHAEMVNNLVYTRPVVAGQLPSYWSMDSLSGLESLNKQVNIQAQTIGYLNDFRLMMWIVLALLPLLLMMRNSKE